jgi:hypothetical protein
MSKLDTTTYVSSRVGVVEDLPSFFKSLMH